MRGQRLFVRPIEPSDRAAIETFLAAAGEGNAAPACGLLGKLVGDLVAVLALEITPDAFRVADLVVAREFRRKRIGRFMLDEAGRLARKLDRNMLVIEDPGAARRFFSCAGFSGSEGRMTRRVE
jgi:GNAT superfamily N-acetyltransferase